MKLNLLKKYFVFIILLFSTTSIFSRAEEYQCGIDVAEIELDSFQKTSIQELKTQVSTVLESKTDSLTEELSFLKDQVLDQDFTACEQKNLAILLQYEVDGKLNSVESDIKLAKDQKLIDKKIKILSLLVVLQKKAQAKLEVLLAADNNILTSREFKVIKLGVLNNFYRDLQKINKDVLLGKVSLKDLRLKRFNNNYVTKTVTNSLKNYGIYNFDSLLKVDFCNLWPKLYENYFEFIDEYRNSKGSLFDLDQNDLNSVLLKIQTQKNILLDIDFIGGFGLIVKKIFGTWAGRINNLEIEKIDDKTITLDSGYYDSQRKDLEEQLKISIKIFDLFFINLIRINSEITKSKHFLDNLNKLDGSKKEIVIGHMVLVENEDFNVFIKDEDFAKCFDAYNFLVEEYLNNDNLNENIFVYKLFSAVSKLNSFKRKKEPVGVLPLLGIASKNKQADSICSLTEDMIQILEQISTKLKEKDGSSIVNAGIVERILNGEIKVPDKIQKLIYTMIQSVLG